MGTINGYTAERMKEIEDQTIVGANVVGDSLVLERHDGSTFNAGVVMGPQGDPGYTEIQALMVLLDPPGTFKPLDSDAVPGGHGLCDAATQYDAADYPLLAALYGTGAACVNGACNDGRFRLPNAKGRVLAGKDAAVPAFDTIREAGGSKDAVAVTHDHNINPSGVHDHNDQVEGFEVAVNVGGVQNDRLGNTFQDNLHGAQITFSAFDEAGNHAHDADPAGVSGVDKNLQPYRVVNWIMRLQ